jgi:DNA-binding MarR family transcriptional regulator
MVDPRPPSNSLDLSEESLRAGIELLFYAYRDFTGEADQMLEKFGLGRAHHRAIYFIGRYPGRTVGHLLGILRITKQSLSRVLKELIAQQYIEQRSGLRDRRERLLHLTDKGVALERELTARQRERIGRAYNECGPESVDGFRKVLFAILDSDHRGDVERALAGLR